MEVLKANDSGVTIELTAEEIGYVGAALFVLNEQPTSEGGNYAQMVGRLFGQFDTLYQMRELAPKVESTH